MEISQALNFIDFSVIVLYIIALLSLGFWVSFRDRHTDDLFLAGRSLKWPNIGLSIFGTNVSPSMMISSAGVAYASGMVASNMEWLAWWFLMLLAMVFVPHYMNTNISTMPEFLEKRFSPTCRTYLSCYTLFATIVLWLGGTLYAGGLLLSQIMGWPIWISIVFLVIIATSFTITGGLAAVVITDSFQSILMILASTILTIIAFVKIGSFEKLVTSVPEDYWTLLRPADDPKFPWYAVLLGYPVGGIWFWCTDQTIVQRVLGGKNAREGQLGCVFAAFLKIIVPFIFFVPGIMCKVLHPNLEDADKAYMTMVTTYLPHGMIGLIVSVLIAALISTVDSGLNSLSTVFTLDIYCKIFKPDSTQLQRKRIGQVVTFAGALIAIAVSLSIAKIPDKNLFEKLLSIIQFLSPPLAAVFIVGVLWRGANKISALLTLIIGSIASVGIGICNLAGWPSKDFYPHFMFLSFLIFAGLIIFMVVISLITGKDSGQRFHSLREAMQNTNKNTKGIWTWWLILAIIMFTLYLIFN
ncbi:Na(+)/glucose symporter [Limihaloglobus sulfuriphilus]|uniref:Na(+)/glucose symporter n=1 Tax=Limihaloglobus sulfuriphilus TaxID=1851148 RepID=A0A1Q2MEA2_9BACT|nr:sodium/solute symporter [Limihaloglobus sulfuriphilus]AQQ71026.1 Na(+)/glucose symporter [Limihaloglobus sulfuriphilus]